MTSLTEYDSRLYQWKGKERHLRLERQTEIYDTIPVKDLQSIKLKTHTHTLYHNICYLLTPYLSTTFYLLIILAWCVS